MPIERCPVCNALGGHLAGCTNAPVPSIEDEQDAEAARNLMKGAPMFLGGLLFSALSFALAMANPNGGSYFIASGAVMVGGSLLLRGLIMGFRNRHK